MIPPRLHFVWPGDEAERPDQNIATWRKYHPDFAVRVWGGAELLAGRWHNVRHMAALAAHDPAAVADLMRWEILLQEGGVAVDAGSVCLQRLPDWLFDCEMFAAWENELARPGLISTGIVGTMPDNPFLARLIEELRDEPRLDDRPAWQATGPLRLTESHRRQAYANLTILPSHFFLPRHYNGIVYAGSGPIFAEQCWDAPAMRDVPAIADGKVDGPDGGDKLISHR